MAMDFAMKSRNSWLGGLKSAIGIIVGAGVAVGVAPLLPGVAATSFLILGWAMTAAGFGTLGRLLYLDWKDALPANGAGAKPVSWEERQTQSPRMSSAVRFPFADGLEGTCSPGREVNDETVSGLTLTEFTPKDTEALLREATAQQELTRRPVRSGILGRDYLPLPQL